MGGLAGAGGLSHQAVKEYAPYLRELKARAEQERRERLAALPDVSPVYRTGPTPGTALAPAYPYPAETETEERAAALPEGSPIYRTGPAPGVPAEPLPAGPAPAAPLKEWEADILREPAPEEGAVGQAAALDLSGRPMMPPADRPLAQRLDALFRLVDETGDPRAAQEIHNLLLANRPEVVAAFRTPEPAGMTLRPLAEKVESLYRQVEETGDFNAARQLHALIEANRQGLTGLSREQLRRLAEQPMVQSAGEVKDLVRDEAMAGEEAAQSLPERVARLTRQVEEEGDPRAAGELNNLLAGNLQLLQGVSRGQIARLSGMAATPMEPSGSQVKELAREPEAPTAPPTAPTVPPGEVAPPREGISPYFDETTTGTPHWDKFLRSGEAKVVRMSPSEYLQKVAEMQGLTLEQSLRAVSRDQWKKYADRMLTGEKAPLPLLDYEENAQEGRARALAAQALGAQTIPVLLREKQKQAPPAPAPPKPKEEWEMTKEEFLDYVRRRGAMPAYGDEEVWEVHKDVVSGALYDKLPVPSHVLAEYPDVALKYNIAIGKPTTPMTATGREVPARFAVFNVRDVITSHDDLLNENPRFPQDLQPRDRTRAASELQVSRIENNPKPQLLGDNPLASDGAPIVGPDRLVESGNARSIALRRAYRAGREGAERYRQWLVEHAADFGLDPEAIARMQRPLLVRVRTEEVQPQERVELVKEFNMPSTAGYSPMEQAENDARALLNGNILTLFEPNDRGEINTAANAAFVQAFMHRVVSPNEVGNYFTADKRLNQAGIARIRNALFAAAYGKSGALEALAESPDDRVRNLTGALAMAAPKMAVLEQRIRQGDRYDVGIATHVARAADILRDIREAGLTFEDGVARVKFLGEADPLVLDLLHLFNDYSRSRVRLQAVLSNYADLAENLGTPKQKGLMNLPVQVTRADLLQKAVSMMEEKHGKGREAIPSERVESEPQGPGVPGPPEKVEGTPAGGEPTPKPQGVTAADIKRLYPDISDEQAAILAADPELRAAVAKGNWEAILRQKAAEQVSDIGAQKGLGIGGGGLFDVEPEPRTISKAEVLEALDAGDADTLNAALIPEGSLKGTASPGQFQTPAVKPDVAEDIIAKAREFGLEPAGRGEYPDGRVSVSFRKALERADEKWRQHPLVQSMVERGWEVVRAQNEAEAKAYVGQGYQPSTQLIGILYKRPEHEIAWEKSLERTGTARHGDVTVRVVPHPSGDDYAIEVVENGNRRMLAGEPMSLPEARLEAIDILRQAYKQASGETTPVTKPPSQAQGEPEAEATASRKLAQRIVAWLREPAARAGNLSNREFFDMADEAFGGTMAEGKYSPKDAYDALELGVNLYIASRPDLHNPHGTAEDIKLAVTNLGLMLDRLPTQAMRTEEQQEFQQFSTPPHLAYVAAWAADINQNDVVLEPSAGVGGLAVFAHNAGAREVVVNELSPRRAALLKEMFFDRVYQENAEQIYNILHGKEKPTVVLMNPPFSATAGRKPGARETQNAQRHVEQALKLLEPNGRLVAILGEGAAPDKAAWKPWWAKIAKEYNVRANIGVSGKVYQKYGTQFGLQVVVIDKTGPTNTSLTARGPVTGKADNLSELIDLLAEVKHAGRVAHEGIRGQGGKTEPGTPTEPVGGAGAETVKGTSGQHVSPRPQPPVVGPGKSEVGVQGPRPAGVAGEHGESDADLEPGERHGGVREERRRGRTGLGEHPEPEAGGETGPGGPGGRTGGATAQPDRGERGVLEGPEVKVEAQSEAPPPVETGTEELEDVIYEAYRPQRLKVPGAKPHPAHLMESAAMAAAVPPAPAYQPHLPKELVEKGLLSDAQMEAVVYAGQAHQETLPDGSRRGFFIGDGTGLGKGREIGAIFMDNWNQGRRKGIWISDKAALVKAAKRDVGDLGWDQNLIFEWGKVKASGKVERSEGIGFLSYDTLKASAKGEGGKPGKSRIDQIVEWLGQDFDGVIAFDESHKMGNALEYGTGRGRKKPSQRALAGLELQKRLPKARVVYVSATGATEVMNLAYAQRLGLWGPETPFGTVQEFVAAVDRAGLAAMELVARDMKSMGLYLSRFLSYQGVETGVLEHELAPHQVETYNELARAWQIVLHNVREVLAMLGAVNNAQARRNAYSLFWGSHQRFFNQVITAMQMPGVLAAVKEDLAAGHAVVLQLTNTLEASQEREIAKMLEKAKAGEEVELEELDMSPKQVLMQYVQHAFPVHEYEAVQDEDGNTVWKPVKDSEGNNVVNPEAERRKQELLERIGALNVPDGPLNILLREFGHEKVAEVTGRKRRMVWKDGQAKLEKRGDAKVEADIDAFLNDEKRILVFSDKGGTGRSYHADLRFKNQRLRRHYLLQPGWRADNALQGFGRSHRSNQKQPPHYILVTTNLKGQKRFISSIARRLDQLGALTRGQRQAGSGGIFRAQDNLESVHARDALVQFYRDLYDGRVEGLGLAEFEAQTGLRLTDHEGSLRLDLPPITQFLNRLLSMEIDDQNRVFDAFFERVVDATEAAAAAGTLDVGVETWKTPKDGRLEKVSEKTVYTEPRTGAETKYVQINEVSPTQFYQFADLPKGFELFVNVKSGNVWAASRQTVHRTLANGEVVPMRHLQGPRSRNVVFEKHLGDPKHYRKVEEAEAQRLWNKEIATAPQEKERTLHFITGAVLPIWDRLQGSTKVFRLQTSQGERLLGRLIEEKHLGQTLRKLGAVEPVKKSPQELFTEVVERNKVLRLANDWTIERRRVAGEDRIEIRGPSYHDQAEIFRHGVFSTLIDYRTRYFIPTDPRVGPQVLERLVENRPVVTVTDKAVREAFRVAPKTAGETIVTQAMVEAAFPGAQVRRGRFFDGFRVLLPNGLEIGVRLNGDIMVPDGEALRAAGYTEADIRDIQKNADDYVLAGQWKLIDGGGVITLAKGLTQKEAGATLRHEVFHAACDLVLTEAERRAILRKFGDWEAAARAYETWEPVKPHGLFQKILDFFRQIYEAFRPTWERTFRRIETGQVWQRQPQKTDVFGEPIRYRAGGPANYEKTGNLPEDFIKTPEGSTNFGEIDKEAAKVIKRQAGHIRLQIGKGDARSGFGLIHIKARHEEEILRLGYPNVESFIHDVAANFIQIRQGRGAALLLVKPNGLNKIAAIELAPGIEEDFYTIKSAWVGRPEYIDKFELLWERRVPVAATPGKAPSLSSSPQRPEKGTPDAEGQSNLIEENIILPGEKGKPRYSIRTTGRDQEAIEAYREKYLAPTAPREPRGVVETARGLKDTLTQKAQRFYDQVVDRWAAWERLAERAGKAGAKVPHGEHITNALSFMRGVEGRVRQALTGEYVYQDKMHFDEDLGEAVFTGDDLVRKGPSFNRRLEPLRELAKRRGVEASEVMDDFEVFLVAQRDLELAGEFGNRLPDEIKGVHPEESKAVIASLIRKYGDDWRVLMDAGSSMREWSDEMVLQPLLQAGFIDELTYKLIKAKNQLYVPYKRLLDQANDYLAAHLGAQGVRGKVLHEIKGSEKQILSPLQTWIELAYKAQWAYARNKVYRAAYLTGKAYEDAGVYEVPAKYVPVDFTQKQEIDVRLRRELMDLARDLKVDVKMVRTLRGRRLGEFSRMLKEEVSEGLLPEEAAGQIRVRFATSEKTLSHEIGHAIDSQYDLVGLLIDRGTPEMRRELRRIADQRATQADSKSYRRYVRKKTEQVAEFVNRYINDRATAKAIAPETTEVFEKFLNQHARLKPLLTFKPSAQAGLLDFQNRVWARSPLPPEEGCVPYYRDGRRRWLKLPPDLYHAAQNLMPAEMGMLMRLARIPADMLKSGAILVPEFSLGRNPVRDIIQAWIFSRFGFSISKWFRDAALLFGKDEETLELRRQWEAGGGVLSTLAESFVEPEKLSAAYLMGKEGKVKYFANPLHALRYVAAYLENLTRFSIYKQAREKGLSHAEAIHEARRTTLDFSRAGGHPTVRYLNMLIPFWNAAVQGMDKLATELTGPNRKAVARRLAVLAGISVLAYLFARTDDRYKELEDWERNYFWHLPLGPGAPLLRIPKPFEAGILFGSVAERLAEALVTKDVKGVKSALGAAWDAATPEVIPTIARPYVEGLANYDFFRGRPIEDAGLQRLPRGLRAKPWTSETAKAVGWLTDISPVQLEHFIRQWTGGLGANYFLPGVDLVLRKTGVVEDIPKPAEDKIHQVWGVGTFFTKPPTGWRAKSVNDFFEKYQEVLLADQGWKALWQSGDTARLEKFLAEHPEAMYARVARKLMDEISKVKKERHAVHASKALTPEQKREKLEALDDRVVELAKTGNAFMSKDAAEAVKMPPRHRTEMGVSQPLAPEDYYEAVSQPVYEAFKEFQGRGRWWQSLDSEGRDGMVEALLRRSRRETVVKFPKKKEKSLLSVI
ncbi:MAG: strawberry notch family protein [Deltaproteobacteria bacterium]|nr:strawberry notch family protein [Deltaproteobacteria bacterium]